ncbi:Defensin-like protein [Stylosanthes scabra]|uniref:Defensin-like protein n=1 Tax=Stylosanthes scabra TaxID=79078 RepID=A0ABU6RWS6_9FABA|nr:Defensin-like protein [Stylosanthes scabra]
MANNFSLYATLLLLAASSVLMSTVVSELCKQDNGDCTADCNTRCTAAFSGSHGKCGATTGGQQRCWCYYDCPALKTCDDDFVMSSDCEENQCTLACVTKHPGRGALGKCLIQYPDLSDSCHCTFFC